MNKTVRRILTAAGILILAALLIVLLMPKSPVTPPQNGTEAKEYYFRTEKLLRQHYEKHGVEMGFSSAEEYRLAACRVINDPASLHKTEKEDGDDIYYVEATNEFVVVSKQGFLRTYFLPDKGIDYFNRQ